MKRRRFLSLATASVGASTFRAAMARPRYGGTLRAYPSALIEALASPVADLCDIQHDVARRAWTLAIKPGVSRHDNTPLTTDALLSALRTWSADVAAAANSRSVVVTPARPGADVWGILAHEARLDCGPFVVHPADRNVPSATPWAEAFEEHWQGRPFVDRVEAAPTAQAAHIAELMPGTVRQFRSPVHRIWSTQPVTLLAIDAAALSPEQRTALSLSIDREAIVRFILQGQGEATAALSPQWLTGSAFLFKTQRDVARARQLARPVAISLSYRPAEPSSRLMAERIALNARDGGLDVRPTAGRPAIATSLIRIPAPHTDSYEAEKTALEERGLIPIAHLPRVFAIHNRLHGWDEAQDRDRYEIRLEEVWLAP